MESACNFEPLWREKEAIAKPVEAIDDIRLRSLRIFLEKNRLEAITSLSLDALITECIYNMDILFYSWVDSNAIIDRLRSLAAQHRHLPLLIIRGAMGLWYTSSIPILSRDPQQGLPSDSEIEVDDEGTTILRWSRQHAAELHRVGNLGLMAMLLSSEIWKSPSHPKMRLATLVSNATTAILYAAYMISPRMTSFDSWNHVLSACPIDEGMKLFIRTAWQLAREGLCRDIAPPGADFGTTLDEVKVTRDGKTLLSKIGRGSWSEAPDWHPCRKVPGSPWNKFMKNICQPLFPHFHWGSTNILFKLPSSTLTLATPWQTHYAQLRAKFDQAGRPRRTVEFEDREAQFLDLAAKSGSQYPMVNPNEISADFAEDIDQEYLYTVPMIKKPITDLRGDLTLPFLTTAARAMRFEDEPDEVERGFFIMTFTHQADVGQGGQ